MALIRKEGNYQKERRILKRHLIVNEVSPELGLSSLVRIRWQKRKLILPKPINVFHYYQGLAYGLPIVNQNWNFLMNWVHLQEQRAFTLHQVFFFFPFMLYPFSCKGESYPHPIRAWQEI